MPWEASNGRRGVGTRIAKRSSTSAIAHGFQPGGDRPVRAVLSAQAVDHPRPRRPRGQRSALPAGRQSLGAIEAGVFPLRIGWHCRDCPVRSRCSARRQRDRPGTHRPSAVLSARPPTGRPHGAARQPEHDARIVQLPSPPRVTGSSVAGLSGSPARDKVHGMSEKLRVAERVGFRRRIHEREAAMARQRPPRRRRIAGVSRRSGSPPRHGAGRRGRQEEAGPQFRPRSGGVKRAAAGDARGRRWEQRLYQLIRQPKPIVDRRFEVEFLDAGVETFAFTFG